MSWLILILNNNLFGNIIFWCFTNHKVEQTFSKLVEIAGFCNFKQLLFREHFLAYFCSPLKSCEQPGSKVNQLVFSELLVTDNLGKVEITVAKLAFMSVHKRVRDLDYEHVDKSN